MMNVLWGLNIIAVKLSVDATGAFTAAMLRQIIVFAVCASALRIVPGRMRYLIGLGALSGGIFYIFINWSLAVSNNVGALAIAGQLGAPFSLILAVIFLGERIHLIRILGMALAFIGVVTLVFDPSAGKEILGLGLTAIGSLVWAFCSLLQRKMRGIPILTIYAWVGLVGTAILMPLALWQEPEIVRALPQLPLRDFGWIAFSAIGSTVLGQGAMSWLLQRHPVTTVVPLTLATPIISVLVASLFFATPLTPFMMIGGSIAMTGVAIVTIRTAGARKQVD